MSENACRQMAQALIFWEIIYLSGSDKAKEISFQFGGVMSLFMKASIPGTHGRYMWSKCSPWFETPAVPKRSKKI
jgi:hypothetical protein